MFLLKVLLKSVIVGGLLFGAFVWAFGLPASWSSFVTITFGVAAALVVGSVLLLAAKWFFIMAIIKSAFSDDE